MNLPRNAQLWFPGWLASRARNAAHRFDPNRPITLRLMFADHYEPQWARAGADVARARVDRWTSAWPRIAHAQLDDLGRPAQWTFFYPEEQYAPELLEPLAELARRGIADVEVHIHHDGEGEANFVTRISRFVDTLHREHGLLHLRDGRPTFGFIHGNWALDNSHPAGRWCGLNNEITLLRDLGCYADFTMPAAPNPCQTRLVNAAYWAVDDPIRPKSHDTGALITPGSIEPPGALICVQGPLTLRPHPRWRVVPSLDVGELAAYAAPSPERARRWLDAAPRVGNEVLLKLFTHGAPESNAGPLLDGFIPGAIDAVRTACRSRGWRVAFATAYDLAQAIESARAA
jgi:hypothetical protein